MAWCLVKSTGFFDILVKVLMKFCSHVSDRQTNKQVKRCANKTLIATTKQNESQLLFDTKFPRHVITLQHTPA